MMLVPSGRGICWKISVMGWMGVGVPLTVACQPASTISRRMRVAGVVQVVCIFWRDRMARVQVPLVICA